MKFLFNKDNLIVIKNTTSNNIEIESIDSDNIINDLDEDDEQVIKPKKQTKSKLNILNI